MSKGSFFSKLAGFRQEDDYDDVSFQDDTELDIVEEETRTLYPEDGELSVDVYSDGGDIVVKAFVPGVRKEELEVTLSRDSVTLRGTRYDGSEVHDDNFHYRELYWGSFSRTISLPDEVDIDSAEATEEKGLLTIRLPKLDKTRQSRIKVKER
jgi:HSP20 family protein